jgi:hypothetical protein
MISVTLYVKELKFSEPEPDSKKTESTFPCPVIGTVYVLD